MENKFFRSSWMSAECKVGDGFDKRSEFTVTCQISCKFFWSICMRLVVVADSALLGL